MSEVMQSDDLRKRADASDKSAEESFQRCDTDGFLSQWALGLSAQKDRLAADILDQGGRWRFPGLFDSAGRRVKAKLVSVRDPRYQYGDHRKDVWLVLDANDRALHWVARQCGEPHKRSKMAMLGLHEDEESAPAKADYEGRGHGLSGSAWVVAKRLDGGYPKGSVVYDS